MFDSGPGASDEDESGFSERRERVKRVVGRFDAQWAFLFERADLAIAESRQLQRQLASVLEMAARLFGRH